jgi:uncharacterized protein
MLKERIQKDLKAALLSGDKSRATTLRGLQSAILYEEVAQNSREQGLGDKAIEILIAKEAKKRQESADLYKKGGDEDRVKAELDEKAIVESYLPEQLTDEELGKLVDDVVTNSGSTGQKAMGQVIGEVKQKSAGRADGARIAQKVKERLAD